MSTKFELKKVKLSYCSIYKPAKPFSENLNPKFCTKFIYNGKELLVHDIELKEIDAPYGASSTCAPVVSEFNKNYNLLYEVQKIAKVRNISMDRLLNGSEVDLTMRPYETRNKYHELTILILLGVTVDAVSLMDKVRSEVA